MCSGCNRLKSQAALADMDFRAYVARVSRWRYWTPGQREAERIEALKQERDKARKAYEEFVCLDTEE